MLFRSTDLTLAIDCTSGVLPAGLTCNVLTPNGANIAGYEGEVRWEMTGALNPSETGTVIYQVTIK